MPSPRVGPRHDRGLDAGVAPGRTVFHAMDMDIDVVLGIKDIVGLLREATPLRIHLTDRDEDRRWVELEQPTEISLLPNLGIRVVSSGRIRYEIAGIQLPFVIRRLQVLLQPVVVAAGTHERLDFKLGVEQADLENVPALADRVLVSAVNDALSPERLGTFWNFGRLLERALHLPERFEPLHQFLLQAPAGQVTITDTEVRLRLRLGLACSRSKARPGDE
jgi:hypothetical protein